MNNICQCGCGKITKIAKRTRPELKDYIKGQPIPFLMGHRIHFKKLQGEEHFNHKGDKAGYKALHLRVQQIRGRAILCENCGSDYFVEWANLTGKYENVMDYKALCRKCHHKLDGHNFKRAKTLGLNKLSIISKKGWETRRKTSIEASSSLGSAEGGVLRE